MKLNLWSLLVAILSLGSALVDAPNFVAVLGAVFYTSLARVARQELNFRPRALEWLQA